MGASSPRPPTIHEYCPGGAWSSKSSTLAKDPWTNGWPPFSSASSGRHTRPGSSGRSRPGGEWARALGFWWIFSGGMHSPSSFVGRSPAELFRLTAACEEALDATLARVTSTGSGGHHGRSKGEIWQDASGDRDACRPARGSGRRPGGRPLRVHGGQRYRERLSEQCGAVPHHPLCGYAVRERRYRQNRGGHLSRDRHDRLLHCPDRVGWLEWGFHWTGPCAERDHRASAHLGCDLGRGRVCVIWGGDRRDAGRYQLSGHRSPDRNTIRSYGLRDAGRRELLAEGSPVLSGCNPRGVEWEQLDNDIGRGLHHLALPERDRGGFGRRKLSCADGD